MTTWLILLNVFVAAFAVIMGMALLLRQVEQVPRPYMDPLPPLLKRFWPAMLFLRYYIVRYLPSALIQKATATVQRTGADTLLEGDDLLALQLLTALVLIVVGMYVAMLMQLPLGLTTPLGALLGLVLPLIKLSDLQKQRQEKIRQHLPIFLDYFNLSVSAGLNFAGAILQAINNAPDGPLKSEFRIVLRDIRAGISRSKALERMGQRVNIPELRQLITAVVQAEARGTSLSAVLKVQAQQGTVRRFQRAEKKAMEAPVKLMGPLVLFVFPVTFVVLLYPIAVKIMESGL